jgi:hypothetical protein
MKRSRKRRKNRWLLPALLVAAAVAAGILVWFLVFYKDEIYYDDDFFDPAAQTGILSGMSENEIQSELDRVVDEGMLDISISSGITFQNGRSEGKADIYNSESNRYIIKVAITLENTGEKVYESKGIKPGETIQYIKLNQILKPGEYPATAMFSAYTKDTHQIVGIAGARIMLYVKQ